MKDVDDIFLNWSGYRRAGRLYFLDFPRAAGHWWNFQSDLKEQLAVYDNKMVEMVEMVERVKMVERVNMVKMVELWNG